MDKATVALQLKVKLDDGLKLCPTVMTGNNNNKHFGR